MIYLSIGILAAILAFCYTMKVIKEYQPLKKNIDFNIKWAKSISKQHGRNI